MKVPTAAPGEDAPQQRAVSVIPPSHTKPAEKRAPGGQAGEARGLAGLSGSEVEQLRTRVQTLEAALEQAQHDAARERAFLSDQHDAFITGLIEDHEQQMAKFGEELEEARRRAAERTSVSGAPTSSAQSLKEQLDVAQRSIEKLVGERERTRETLLRLQAQRDEAQATVARLTRERDQGRSEVAQLKIQQGMEEAIRQAAQSERPPHPSSRPPAPTLSALKPTVRPAAQNAPTARPMIATAAASPRPLVPQASTRSTAPIALKASSTRPGAATLSEKPASGPLKSKPDPSTRPLVGYSMTETSEERVDTSRITAPTRPPKI